ncbi:MAG: DUF1937 family protein [Planctomycetaceae bacterium]|nr:MAG: DUF1937 family protein [Planctomycetaceae bacterium]
MKIYVAGPYTKYDVAINVRNAVKMADKLARRGHTPFVPHLTHFWHIISPHTYEFWLEQDLEWLSVCDALIRLPGESDGADKEVAYAVEHGIPVFYRLSDVPEEQSR